MTLECGQGSILSDNERWGNKKMESGEATPEPYQVAFENEYVRIVHVTLASGQKPPKYTPAALPMVRINLSSNDRGAPLGSAYYSEGPLSEEPGHRGETALHEIRVELKAAPEAAALALDAVRVDPARYKVGFENQRVRVVRLRFGPHEKGLMVAHPPRVLVTLTDVAVKLVFADGRTDQRGAPAGVAAWLDEETLQTENAGDQPLEVVLVEPKSSRGF